MYGGVTGKAYEGLPMSIDMTSNVKSWHENSHDVFCMLRSSLVMWCIGRAGASHIRRLILLLSVGWRAPDVYSSEACLGLGSSVLYQPLHAAEGDTTPGLRLIRCTVAPLLSSSLSRELSWP
jgi:hypothetical protein